MKLILWRPVKPYEVNQPFGNPDPKYTALGMVGHNGIDFQAIHGQPVYASHDGVCYPEIDDRGGNGVVIRTLQTFDYNGQQVYFKTIYWHLINANAVVKTGQVVKTGDLVGYADSTGLSTGDHLHFGLKPQAYNENDFSWYNPEQTNGFLGAVDPAPYLIDKFAQDYPLWAKLLELYKQLLALLQRSASKT